MPHRHPEDRIHTGMSGVFYIGLGDQFDSDKVKAYPPGSVIVLPGDTPHFHWAKSGEYITQVTAIGPLGLEYMDPGGPPYHCERDYKLVDAISHEWASLYQIGMPVARDQVQKIWRKNVEAHIRRYGQDFSKCRCEWLNRPGRDICSACSKYGGRPTETRPDWSNYRLRGRVQDIATASIRANSFWITGKSSS
jgi:hypothetical protein